MQKILDDLNAVAGVKGSMVLTEDGMVVASALGPDLDNETVAAVSSQLIRSIRLSQDKMDIQGFSRYVLTGSHGKMVFVDLSVAYLVVITHQNIKLDVILIEIQSTAYRITHRRAN